MRFQERRRFEPRRWHRAPALLAGKNGEQRKSVDRDKDAQNRAEVAQLGQAKRERLLIYGRAHRCRSDPDSRSFALRAAAGTIRCRPAIVGKSPGGGKLWGSANPIAMQRPLARARAASLSRCLSACSASTHRWISIGALLWSTSRARSRTRACWPQPRSSLLPTLRISNAA